MNKNYYEILQISKDATEEEIKTAYKRLARMYHPDNNPGNKEVEIKFRKISEAYAVLSNPEKRKQYDSVAYNPTGQSTATTDDAYEIFNALFRDDIKRYNNQREDYIQFLDEMEPEFNKYNRTLKKEKAATLNSSWSLLELLDNFYDKKARIVEQLNELKRNAQAFDDFLIFFEEAKKK